MNTIINRVLSRFRNRPEPSSTTLSQELVVEETVIPPTLTEAPNPVEEESTQEQSMQMINLGLPSGTLWAANEQNTEGGNLPYPEFMLPTYEQAAELIECCEFRNIIFLNGMQGVEAQGPNGNRIIFRLTENEATPFPSACCWVRGREPGSDYQYFLLISEYTLTIGFGSNTMSLPYRCVLSPSLLP